MTQIAADLICSALIFGTSGSSSGDTGRAGPPPNRAERQGAGAVPERPASSRAIAASVRLATFSLAMMRDI